MTSVTSNTKNTLTRGVKREIRAAEGVKNFEEITFLVAKTESGKIRNYLEQHGIVFSEKNPLFGHNATFVVTATDQAGFDHIEEVVNEFNAIMYASDAPWAQETKNSSNLRHRKGYADDVLVFEEIIVTVRKSDSTLVRDYLTEREMSFTEEWSFFNRKVTFVITAEDNRSFPHMAGIMDEFCSLAV